MHRSGVHGTGSKAAALAAAFFLAWLTAFSSQPALAQQDQKPTVISKELYGQWEKIRADYRDRNRKANQKRIRNVLKWRELQKHLPLKASMLLMLARSDYAEGDFEEMIADVVPLLEETLPHMQAADADNLILGLADAYGRLKRYDGMDAMLERYEQRFAQRSGEDSFEHVMARMDSAILQMQSNREKLGKERILKAVDEAERNRAPGDYLLMINHLAGKMERNAESDFALELYKRGLASPAAGNPANGAGFLHFNISGIYLDRSKWKQALNHARQALGMLAVSPGMDSPHYINALDRFAQTLQANGRVAAASGVMQKAVERSQELYKDDNPEVWRVNNNYASILRSLKRPRQALEADRFAFEKRREKLGPNHPETLISQRNLAMDYIDLGKPDEAVMLLRTLPDQLKKGRSSQTGIANAQAWLRVALIQAGVADVPAREIDPRTTSLDSYSDDVELGVAMSAALGEAARKAGKPDFEKALLYHGYSNAARRLGEMHPITLDALLTYAKHFAESDRDEQLDVFMQLDDLMFRWTRTEVMAAGSREAAEAARVLADDLLMALGDLAEADQKGKELFARAATRWKTLQKNDNRRLRRLADTTQDAQLRRAIRQYLSTFARFSHTISTRYFGPEEAKLERLLDNRREAVDAGLVERGLAKAVPTTDDIAQSTVELPKPQPGERIVEFVLLRDWQGDRLAETPSARLYAVIYAHDAAIELRRLDGARSKIGFSGPADSMGARLLAEEMKAVLAGDGTAKTIFVIPDGFLYSVSFADVVGQNNKPLVTNRDVRTLTSLDAYFSRAENTSLEAGDEALLVGDLSFANEDSRGAKSLPGTAREISFAQKLASKHDVEVKTLRAKQADELTVRTGVSDKTLAHFATHGFFKPAIKIDSDPYLQSGLLLSQSGSNRDYLENPGDNVAYSAEVMHWDFTAAEMVMITACDSAVGTLGFVNPVQGLPKALAIAGARRSIVALRPIPDSDTALFVQQFYRHLLDNRESWSKAFLETKRDAYAGRIEGLRSTAFVSALVMFEN